MLFDRIVAFYRKNPSDFRRRLRARAFRSLCGNRAFRALRRVSTSRPHAVRFAFLVGCYNSGTTILKDVLAAHPDVASLPLESQRFTDVFRAPEDLGWVRNWVRCRDYVALPGVSQPEDLSRWLKDVGACWQNPGASLFLDKSISNIERMPWIEENFTEVKFVGIVRNGYAAAEGMCRKAAPLGRARLEYGGDRYTFGFAAEQWMMANEHMMKYSEFVRAFHLVRYEEFAADPYSTIKGVCQFLELDPNVYSGEDGVLSCSGQSFSIVNQNEFSMRRIGNDEIKQFDEVAGPMMIKFGYPLAG